MLDENTISQLEQKISEANKHDEEGDIHIHVAKRRQKITPINTFALCFTASLAEIMDKFNLSRGAIRLLLELLNTSKAGNLISINQKGMAKRLKISNPTISRHMKELHSTGILLQTDTGVFLNPQLITKQGLDTVAKNFRNEVVIGIEALEALGMDKNWMIPTN